MKMVISIPKIAFTCFVIFFLPTFCFGEENLPAMIKRVEPSIIIFLTYSKDGSPIGQGTGFFVSNEGDAITNYHVLRGASRAVVKTSEDRIYPVKKVIAEDEEGDLIRVSVDIPKEAVHPLSIYPSFPEVGERIIVIGTPLGLEKTVSDGIVSAVREIPKFGKIIQVTAPISQGSSGSPVVNLKGEVVGVVSFFLMPGQNLNFAIPGERITKLTLTDGKTLSEWEDKQQDERLEAAKQLYNMGRTLLWAEDYEKALSYFAEALKRNPNDADTYFQIGYCLGRLGRYSEAVELYRQAAIIKPDDIDTLNNLCVTYSSLGRYPEAIETCKQAIRIKADLPEAYNNLGWVYQRLGRYQEAIELCKKALRIKPDFALAHYNLGNNYIALKKFDEAIESFKQAIRINFDYAEGHLNLGASYYQKGQYEEAIESYKEAVRLKPSLAEAHLNLGMTYLRIGNRGSALEEYKTLKSLDKDFANILFNLIYE
jgi:tetratricopeptide (TPR) repeat protein